MCVRACVWGGDYLFDFCLVASNLQAGDRIAQKYGKSRLRAIFLHAVSEKKGGYDLEVPRDRVANGVPIFYFRTYVGAAYKAYKNNLISSVGLTRVIDAARSDLAKIPNASEDFKRSLEADIAAAGRKRSSSPLAFLNAPSSNRWNSFASRVSKSPQGKGGRSP